MFKISQSQENLSCVLNPWCWSWNRFPSGQSLVEMPNSCCKPQREQREGKGCEIPPPSPLPQVPLFLIGLIFQAFNRLSAFSHITPSFWLGGKRGEVLFLVWGFCRGVETISLIRIGQHPFPTMNTDDVPRPGTQKSNTFKELNEYLVN